jgi:hypothetical protein
MSLHTCVLSMFSAILQKDILKSDVAVGTLKQSLIMVNLFTSSHKWKNEAEKYQKQKNIKHKLCTYADTRFYAASKTLQGVVAFGDFFQECLKKAPSTNASSSHEFWGTS